MNPSTTAAHSPSVISRFLTDWTTAWNRFWFSERDPIVLGIIRIWVGAIVFYTHMVWTLELSTFMSSRGMLLTEYRQQLFGNSFAWSHLDFISSGGQLLVVHVLGLVIIAMFTLGIWTRVTAALTVLVVISYANRGMGALFGLDQINAFLCLYLAIGNCGGAFSFDRWRRRNRTPLKNDEQGRGDVWTNIATRLIQIHMCIVYLFAGIGKLQGDTWFTGEAIWGALSSYEYQTLDMTWMADHMWLVALLTLGTLAWELSYAALVWSKLTRPIVLLIAIPMHLGIGICMGMMTFGLIMLAGNIAFLSPEWIHKLTTRPLSND